MAFADMADKRIPQPDPVAAMQPQYVKSFQVYDLSNPHPGFGTDPNILNEYGHTKYPMLIYPNGKDQPGVVVNSAEEEAELMQPKTSVPVTKDILELKQDGPTIQEFVARGYDPSTYPPKGYAIKSTKEEIDAAIAAHNNKSGGW